MSNLLCYDSVYNYNGLPKLSATIRKRRLQFAGHCIRADKQVVSKLVLWETDGAMRVGGGNITTYLKLMLDDMNTVQRYKAYKQEDIYSDEPRTLEAT